jgi:hypothetical protein
MKLKQMATASCSYCDGSSATGRGLFVYKGEGGRQVEDGLGLPANHLALEADGSGLA